MSVTLHFFGQLRQLAGGPMRTVEAGLGLDEALRRVAADCEPQFGEILFAADGGLRPSVMILVNDQPIERSRPPQLKPGDAVSLMSAIAGG